jgi:hypothetical protein
MLTPDIDDVRNTLFFPSLAEAMVVVLHYKNIGIGWCNRRLWSLSMFSDSLTRRTKVVSRQVFHI